MKLATSSPGLRTSSSIWCSQRKLLPGLSATIINRLLESGKKAEVSILAETASLPRHLVSIRRDLAPPTAKGLEQALLGMHQNREGRAILEKADATTKFDALPGGELAIRQRLLDAFYTPQKESR